MLQSYQAEISDNKIVWLGQAPSRLASKRVVIVIDEAEAPPAAKYDFSSFAGKLAWNGDAIAETRRLRDEW